MSSLRERAHRFAPVDWLIAAGLAAAALGLYLATLAPGVLGGDAGEFQFVAPLLGVAHPTGYPLYILLGWVWTHLLPAGDDAAFRMNLFSAVSAAMAAGVFYLAALTFLRRATGSLAGGASRFAPRAPTQRALAAFAAAILAATPTLWSQAVIAEVYGLHTLLVALLFALLLVWGDGRDRRVLALGALVFGLGLAHHRTTLLLAPAAVVYVWLVDRAPFRDRRFLLQAALLVLLPQLLYLLIPLRAPHTPYLHLPLSAGRELVLYENTPASFLDFVLGGPFGGSLDLSVDLGDRLSMAAGLLRDEVGWAGIALAAAGLAWLIATRRVALLALSGLAYTAVVAFNLVYTIGDIFVLFIPSYIVVTFWIATGAGVLATLAAHAIRSLTGGSAGTARVALLMTIPLVLLPLALVSANYHAIDRSTSTSARDRWQTILSLPLPEDSVLVTDDRNEIMPLWYLQYVDGARPDLLGLFPLITEDQPSLGHVLDLALSTDRPVYLIKEMPGIEVKVDVTPDAGLWRVLGPAVEGEPEYEVGEMLNGGVALAGYDRTPRSPRPGEMLQIVIVWETLAELEAPYQSYVHLVDSTGRALAQSDHRPGDIFYPTTRWRPGERLRDEHVLRVPPSIEPGVYTLLAGMYRLTEDGDIQTVGDAALLGAIAVKTGEAPAAPEPQRAVGTQFGDELELVGYDVAATTGTLDVTLHWRTLQSAASDYTVFVHLLDAAGEIVAQDDAPPRGGAYPTSVWDAGEIVLDLHTLPLPAGTSTTDLEGFQLRTGLYHQESGERLPTSAGSDQVTLPLYTAP